MAKGIVINYRGSYKTKRKTYQTVIEASAKTKEEAGKMVGKKVTWTNGKTSISGKVTAAHGNKGALRVRFDKGLPGEAIGTSVEIKE